MISVDNLMLLTGLILNGISAIFAFIYGHTISAIILVLCELILGYVSFSKLI